MIEALLHKRNLNLAYQQVYANKGAGGVDGMPLAALKSHLAQNGHHLVQQIRAGSYQPSPIKGVEILKSNGKTRLLGVPTATGRVFQQALHWKCPEKKRRSLIRLGVRQGQAYAWSRSRMGGWAIAQSPMLRTTITVSRLKQRGYISMVEYYHSKRPS